MKKDEKKTKSKKIEQPNKTSNKKISEVEEMKDSKKEATIEQKQKKKKKHIFLKIVIAFLVIFIVFPIAFVFIAFYDTSTKANLPASHVSYENTVATAIREGLDDAKSGKISLSLGEEELDGVLLYACDQLSSKNQMVDQFLDKMYCTISGKEYNFYVDLHASFFKTRVILETKMVEQKSDDGNTLIFKIQNVKIGRLPLPINLVTMILGKFMTDEKIENAFRNTGFNIHCNLEKAEITYKQSDFQNDVAILLSSFAGDNHYIQILLELMGDEEIINISFENAVNAAFNLVPLSENESYHKTKQHFFNYTELDDFKKLIIDCLKINPNFESEAANAFTYLIRGKSSNSSVIELVKNFDAQIEQKIMDFTGKSIEEYEGAKVDGDIRFSNKCVSDIQELIGSGIAWATEDKITQFITGTLNELELFKVNSYAINEYIASLDKIIGKTVLSTSYNKENDAWNLAYIVVDNLYAEISEYNGENKLIIYLGLNINGFETTMIIPTSIESKLYGFSLPSTIGNIKLNIDNENDSKKIYYGRKLIPSTVQNILLSEMPLEGTFKYIDNTFLFNIDDAYPSTQATLKNQVCTAINLCPEENRELKVDNDQLKVVIKK